MAVILKGIVCGDKKVGKSSFLEQISGNKRFSNTYEVDLRDPSSQSEIKFLVEETCDVSDPRTICIFLVYSLSSQNSFESVKQKWFPMIQSKTSLSNSFVIIIGTHSDAPQKFVDSHEAEEFAASNGAFHMEISTVSKRNIELTLKLMRIRAFYLLRKHPELKIDDYNDENIMSTQYNSELNTCNSFSLDIPLPFKDFSTLQSKKNRYEESEKKTFAESVFESSGEKFKKGSMFKDEKNMSFADMSESDEIPNLSDEEIEENFKEISIDTLGSPSWHQKVPPLSMIGMPTTAGYPQTERNHSSVSNFLESGSSTERANKEPILILEIAFEKIIKKIEVFADDNAFSLAERALGYHSDYTEALSETIEKAVNDYVKQVRNFTVKKPLYRVKIAIGNNWGEIVVHEGDSLETIAQNFVKENKLSDKYQSQILKLLIEAGEKHYS